MWDEGSRLYGVKELALTWALPGAAIIISLNWPWTALVFVPAFCAFVVCRENNDRLKQDRLKEERSRREALAERNQEIGERVCELRGQGMEYEDIFNRLKAEGRRGPDSE